MILMYKRFEAKTWVMLGASLVVILCLTAMWVVFAKDPNDTYPRSAIVRDNRYVMQLNPAHPAAGKGTAVTVTATDRNTGKPASKTSFILIVTRLSNDPERAVNIGPAKEIGRDETTSDANGRIEFQLKVGQRGNYRLSVVPSALWSDKDAVTQQNEAHPDYKDQPAGPTFSIYVKQ
jgi:hypothetical protein